jgi:hypothetical protein
MGNWDMLGGIWKHLGDIWQTSRESGLLGGLRPHRGSKGISAQEFIPVANSAQNIIFTIFL